MTNPLKLLEDCHSWQINKISPTTFSNDIQMTLRRKGQKVSEKEMKAIRNWMRNSTCYRVRIGKGRFFFGKSTEEAIQAALRHEKRK